MTIETPDHLGHRQRLRTRFLSGGGKNMPDYELLELILTTTIPRRDVKPLAKDLIRKFGNFANVVSAPIEELLQIDGIKETSACAIKLIAEGAIRMSWQNLNNADAKIINNWDTMIDYCRTTMAHQKTEEFKIIFLNSKLVVIGEESQQRGTVDHVSIHPREVIKSAMLKGASAMILVHNHPSGNVKPSKADIEITKTIISAATAVSIQVFDHIIISKTDVFSFREKGLV